MAKVASPAAMTNFFPEKIVLTSRTTLTLNDRFTVIAESHVPETREHYVPSWRPRNRSWQYCDYDQPVEENQYAAWMDMAVTERRSVHERLGYNYAIRDYAVTKAHLGYRYYNSYPLDNYRRPWKERESFDWMAYDSIPFEQDGWQPPYYRGRGRWFGGYRGRSYYPRGPSYRSYRRGGQPWRGRWGRYFRRGPPPSREQLDTELDDYMSQTKSHLDSEIDSYMGRETA